MGKVEENKLYLLDSSNSFMESGLIQRDMDCLLYLCQDAYMNHQRSAEVLNDKYIVAQSVLVGMLYAYQFNGKSMDTVLFPCRVLSKMIPAVTPITTVLVCELSTMPPTIV